MASKVKPQVWKGALAACVFLAATSESCAQSSGTQMNGAGFLSACSRPDPEWIGFCHGYVQAIVDGPRRPAADFCVPPGTTRATIVGTIVEQLAAAPELKDMSAAAVAHGVLHRKFPCRR
jgi:Ssp1 endopeptidase immunity protein Rap1a